MVTDDSESDSPLTISQIFSQQREKNHQMGKFRRKARIALDVAVMDVSQARLGVRTRAKTLALQPAVAPPPNPDVCYLELRSRRLEKHVQRQNSRTVRRGCGCKVKSEVVEHGVGFSSASIEGKGLGGEAASFEGNNRDCEARERGTSESTPCNAITAAGSSITPSSTTKQTCMVAAYQRVRSGRLMNSPSAVELDEFFTPEEQSLQHCFINKYNFDIINDMPLPGRYEWVAVRP